MTDDCNRAQIDDRVLATTQEALRAARDAARRTSTGLTSVAMPATAIDGLLGMLGDPTNAEFWYRRRQFVMFMARTMRTEGERVLDAGQPGFEPDHLVIVSGGTD